MEVVFSGDGASPERGVAAVNTFTAWVDAKPYRLKLILLAHTTVVAGVILLLAIPF